jgi:tetratricopeptide (TPR) repeat protein
VIGVYGVAAPVFDWSWFLWQARSELDAGRIESTEKLYDRAVSIGGDGAKAEILRLEVEHSELEHSGLDRVMHAWSDRPIENRWMRSSAGYEILYDALVSRRLYEEGEQILDELIRLVDEELLDDRDDTLLNAAAWFRAKRGKDLATALLLAKEACSIRDEPTYLNTLGWVQFLLGDAAEGISNLEEAAREMPLASHFLYLALAYKDSDKERARLYVELAYRRDREQRDPRIRMPRHEKMLLDDLQASLLAG